MESVMHTGWENLSQGEEERKKTTRKLWELCISHRVQICGQFFNGRFQIVNGFQTILEETEQEAHEFIILLTTF